MSEHLNSRPNGIQSTVAEALSDAAEDLAAVEPQVKAATSRFLKEARATLEDVTEELLAKAREGYDVMRDQAVRRGVQTVGAVRERPAVALAAAAGLGFLIGHLISAHRTQVIYLKDAR
ncbi:hypothetical protein [Phenylobacterium aquaticum]|uniref:hypothetical protein n=1 Tax=Phenylobacterium aquaticum TaxID=1763816 RepID=UPI001F5CF4F3|nr:hypothetical protein [Phenylobacterium aquaticum]MCI3131732.1 hypothetical protein [Phenylobacterium aquaticum]